MRKKVLDFALYKYAVVNKDETDTFKLIGKRYQFIEINTLFIEEVFVTCEIWFTEFYMSIYVFAGFAKRTTLGDIPKFNGALQSFQEEANRGKQNWEHLNEDLHVLLSVEDTENRAKVKLQRAVEEVKKLLVPADGEDELKKRQLMELAIINGTYRDSNAKVAAVAGTFPCTG